MAVIRSLPPAAVEALAADWNFRARDSQLAPPGDWRTWLILAGRGFGKTRCGAEWVLDLAARGTHRRIHLVGATAADVRDTMIEGESGILTIAPPWNRPDYRPSKRVLVWKNGVRALCFTAEKPRQLRGPQCHAAWGDELAAWQYTDAWDQLQMGTRLGSDPKTCVTTTPRPTKIIRELLASPSTRTTRGTTYDNAANLAPQWYAETLKKYEGTRLGRQELNAEVLGDTPGALWTLARLDATRVAVAPDLTRVCVAVDPSATSSETSAETGIIGAGVDADGEGFVLGDRSGKYSPAEWGETAVLFHDELEADFIVAEANQGGEMVGHVIRSAAEKLYREGKRSSVHVVVRLVHASRGKQTRAEPIAAFFEQARAHLVGVLAKLEDQLTTWDASSGAPSPDRLDALVWALWALMIDGQHSDGGVARAGASRGGRGRR